MRLTKQEAARRTANNLGIEHSSEYYTAEIIHGFQHLRLREEPPFDIDFMEITELPEPLEPHSSCKMKNVDSSTTDLPKNEVSQYDLKQKLTGVERDSEVMKFFEEHKCSVCLNNYNEILNEDFHIVVPSCGHPLCCKCADKVLAEEKKECPSCRENFTVQSFDVMKFNEDLTVKTDDRRTFL